MAQAGQSGPVIVSSTALQRGYLAVRHRRLAPAREPAGVKPTADATALRRVVSDAAVLGDVAIRPVADRILSRRGDGATSWTISRGDKYVLTCGFDATPLSFPALFEYDRLRTPRVRIVPDSGTNELQPIRRHFEHHEVSWECRPEKVHGG